jgi:hypothetical protein
MSPKRRSDKHLQVSDAGSPGLTVEQVARRRTERGYRRAVRTGLLISFVLHAGVFVASGVLRLVRPQYPLVLVEDLPRPPGLVVVGVEELQSPAPPEEVQGDARRRRPEETQVVEIAPVEAEDEEDAGTDVAPAAEEPAEEPEDGLTNAERLRPRYSDERVWFDFRDRPLYGDRLARYARADSAVRSILSGWLDSLALDAEQRQKAMDWTAGEGDERWGVSNEGLHLGKITIPIPFGFAPSGPQRREFEQALRDLAEIQRQELRREFEEVAEERGEEMRRRTEEELERRAAEEEADSTSVGRRGGGGG